MDLNSPMRDLHRRRRIEVALGNAVRPFLSWQIYVALPHMVIANI